jgi:hypothetical protein
MCLVSFDAVSFDGWPTFALHNNLRLHNGSAHSAKHCHVPPLNQSKLTSNRLAGLQNNAIVAIDLSGPQATAAATPWHQADRRWNRSMLSSDARLLGVLVEPELVASKNAGSRSPAGEQTSV